MMAGESVLIVDDTPVNLKLTRILLVNEGYKVLTAPTAEDALELLRSCHPDLVLADIQLPGIDGLELTRRIKSEASTRDITVVALTAFAMKGDEQRAIEAGCDGYITKPIDTRALGARIRGYLDQRKQTPPAAPKSDSNTELLPQSEMLALRRRFLDEGHELVRQWLRDLDGTFHADDAARAVHQWIGTAGLLGYTAISRLCREMEAVLRERPLDAGQLRESLANLVLAFSTPREARDAPVPDAVLDALSSKQVALIGFPANEAERMSVGLERARAQSFTFSIAEPENSKGIRACDVIVISARPENQDSRWMQLRRENASVPLVFVGPREQLLEMEVAQATGVEFLMEPWDVDEALVRLSLACSRPAAAEQSAAPSQPAPTPRTGKLKVVVADDDPTVLVLVRAAIENFGMECVTASDGTTGIETIRRVRPDAAVLDVNMPGMDGYEVLAAIRGESIPTRVLLLTARQQEGDVIRAFSLGADDYVVKPFSPLELVARLKRLLVR
jgi:two-component system, cell cycle response regulator DivK